MRNMSEINQRDNEDEKGVCQNVTALKKGV